MKIEHRHKTRVYSIVLLGLFIGLLCSTSLFYHTHIVDETVIVHSHPYSGSTDNPGHSHSRGQLAAVASLSMLLMLAVAIGMLIAPPSGKELRAAADRTPARLNPALSYNALRGPPALS